MDHNLITDDLEAKVAKSLLDKGVSFLHESQNNQSRLDFSLAEHNVFIEVKKYYSERSSSQLQSQDNIIFLQGVKAVDFFTSVQSTTPEDTVKKMAQALEGLIMADMRLLEGKPSTCHDEFLQCAKNALEQYKTKQP